MAGVPEPVDEALAVWLAAHDEVTPGTIEGLYVVGSVALDDWTPHSDVDVVAVVADPSDPDLAGDLAAAHALVRQRTDRPIDGPFVAWGDLVVPPMAVQRPWVLDGELHVDGESAEINPVTWFTLAERGIPVRGPSPERIGVHVDEADRRTWVRENLDTYWRGVGERLAAALESDTREEGFDGAVLEWTVLGVARMLYTYETGEAAIEQRRRPGTVTRSTLQEAVEFVEQVLAVVA